MSANDSPPTAGPQALRAKLEAEILPAEWKMLKMHARREALFLVAEPLELVDAALAVAQDQPALVGAWLQSGELRRPTAAEAARWLEAEDQPLFRAVIVQPFVLAQLDS